jgi:peroxiredoxin
MDILDRRSVLGMLAGLASASAPLPSVAATATGLSAGMAFPDVVYRSEVGQTRRVSASRGQVCMIYLWAVWCPICYNDIVNIQSIYDGLKNNPKFAAVVLNLMDDYAKGVAWARARGITLPLADSGMSTRQSTVANTVVGTFEFPRATPQFFLLDKTGIVVLEAENKPAGTAQSLLAIQSQLSAS